MKKTLGIIAAVFWLVFGITGVIRWTAGDGGLMAEEMLKTAPPETTGLPGNDYPGVCAMTAEYLTGRRETFQYVTAQGTDGTACMRAEVFQDHEAAHMEDVRGLIRLDLWVCIGSGTLAVLATAAGFLRRDGRKRFLRGMMQGILGTAGIALLLGAWALLDFDGLFVTFHRVAFRNDGWLLNPKTDLLIRLMPVTFFIRLGVRGLLRFALFAAVFTAAVGIGLRRKKDEV